MGMSVIQQVGLVFWCFGVAGFFYVASDRIESRKIEAKLGMTSIGSLFLAILCSLIG